MILLILLYLPAVTPDYFAVFVTRVVLLCLLALSFDLAWGYGGIMSFGQALYFGAAGYASALMARDVGVTSAFIILPLAILLGSLFAAVIGALILIARHPPALIVVAIGTMSGAYIAERVARGWYYLGGQNGISGLPYLTVSGTDITEGPVFYYCALGLLLVVYLSCRWLTRSQFGLALAAARQNERRAAFLGAPVQAMRMIVFTLAGGIAGLGGSLYAFHEGFVGPVIIGVALSTKVVIGVLLGGTGSLIGAVLGMFTIELASYLLADRYAGIWPMLLGLLLLAVVLVRPSGLISLLVSDKERVARSAVGRLRTLQERVGAA
ncbi:branched-chain amino acid ABC transporter permease [Bradyrhizobium barranii subsp. apii]|uniref:Branched-chain amino acid ABC transporter permease n=1 Tax=Bradyrhizobium barranii subsp. apii TaxID=2819348 RepID=A0A8T5VAV4_9BRAD|nr:branched-chain amino acid ABC transporter permease [Bradyrhizobium barranii]UPT86967.1 branched-chain amino acid ABC transporter permease [Bradyrhizobium barranii subsp. apii]